MMKQALVYKYKGGTILKKIIANIYHHTHWDNEWYFTEEDSLVQFSYHMKELLNAFEKNIIDYFFLDGQTAIIEDYINLHPEDKNQIKELISQKKLFVGPFNTQLDSFITSGESVINNLRYGINYGNELGGASLVAYLPDSFGQSQDFPKIFNQLGIDSFVFRRGLGDEHDLPLDFIFRSNDGSEVVANTLYCGYGFATEPFCKGTLLSNAGLDYDGKDISSQLNKLVELSTLEDEFLLPIGNDQTPVIWNFKEKLAQYQSVSNEFSFQEVTLLDYMKKLTKNKSQLKVYEGELMNPQYHRVHRSICSARMDIKIVQDKIERMMALEIQPMMTILAELGFDYDHKLVNRIWNLLARSQTHSAATNTDKTNNLILTRSERALNLAEALKTYLVRKVGISNKHKNSSITLFNTLPYDRKMLSEVEIYTKTPFFNLVSDNIKLNYQVKKQVREYGGNVRTDTSEYDDDQFYYKSLIVFEIPNFPGFSYQTVYIEESGTSTYALETVTQDNLVIENDSYLVSVNEAGVHLTIKTSKKVINNFIYLEESGDEGDNYDYSYPSDDMINIDLLNNVTVETTTGVYQSELILKGELSCPKDLESRKVKQLDSRNSYTVRIKLSKDSQVIDISGTIENHAKNHRVRLVSKTNSTNRKSMAGTQFGVVQRTKEEHLLKKWQEEGWLEEPSPIYPLLNFVSVEDADSKHIIYTKSSKEYELLENEKSEIAITLFRSVGYMGLPDLNRRPGRASGLAERLIPSPESQMLASNEFHVGISIVDNQDYTDVINEYNKYAVETIAYQNQNLNRVVTPISYFETNPMAQDIPDNFSLVVENQPLAFSTLEKINGKNIVRCFNNKKIVQDLSHPIDKLNLSGEFLKNSSKISVGEIVNYEL